MIRIAICDNDTAASDKLAASIKTLAASHKANCQIRCFSKGTPLLYEIEDNIQFDLFFLETQLPDMDGFVLVNLFCNTLFDKYLLVTSLHWC